MANDVLMLICPDWHPPTLVLDGHSGAIVYGNLPFLSVVHKGEALLVESDKLRFRSSELDRSFKFLIEDVLVSNTEKAVLVGRTPRDGPLLSVTVRNPQGLLRTLLERGAPSNENSGRRLIVEIRNGDAEVDPFAVGAVGHALNLDAPEFEILCRLVGSKDQDTKDNSVQPECTDSLTLESVVRKADCRTTFDLLRLILALSPN